MSEGKQIFSNYSGSEKRELSVQSNDIDELEINEDNYEDLK